MTRRRKLEDYMKTIYRLQVSGAARGADIAEALHVSRPTVSVSLRELEAEGYLIRKADHTVCLTPKGLVIALEIADRNRTLYDLLVRLGVRPKTAEKDACEMEHAISQESCAALTAFASGFFEEKTM